MRRRWFRFLFFLILSLLTLTLMYLLLCGEGMKSVDVKTTVETVDAENNTTSVDQVSRKMDLDKPWKFVNIYKLARLLDKYPYFLLIFLGVIALIEAVTALMYLSTPAEAKMIRYTQGNNEVLVNLDTIAESLEKTVRSEPDVHLIRVVLRVPPGKHLHIHCYIRLDLREQVNIPRRVEQLRERIRTHFEQALPLEAKITSSVELKIVTSKESSSKHVPVEQELEKEISGDFQGPIFPDYPKE